MTAVDPGHRMPAPPLSAQDRSRLGRRAQLLAGASVTQRHEALSPSWLAAASSTRRPGPDSLVEMSSGLIILWQFRRRLPETRERAALRAIAISFFALAVYVAFESVRGLLTGEGGEASRVGIIIATLSLVIMPVLSWAQRRTGRQLGSATVVADSKQTLLCTYLSAVLLVGLLLNATLGWWWADPAVGLVIAALAVREGREAWRGDACTCIPAPRDLNDDGCSDGCDTSPQGQH
jgi:hypothetical protein